MTETMARPQLSDRYTATSGRVQLTGIQALARLPIDQRRRDQAAGLNVGAFVSGYEGSPLAGYDLELGRQKSLLDEHATSFVPGLNEEAAATAVQGSQLACTCPAHPRRGDRRLVRQGAGTRPRHRRAAARQPDGRAPPGRGTRPGRRRPGARSPPPCRAGRTPRWPTWRSRPLPGGRPGCTRSRPARGRAVPGGGAVGGTEDRDRGGRRRPRWTWPRSRPAPPDPPGAGTHVPTARLLHPTLGQLERDLVTTAPPRAGVRAPQRAEPGRPPRPGRRHRPRRRRARPGSTCGGAAPSRPRRGRARRRRIRLLQLGMPWPLEETTIREFADGLRRDRGRGGETLVPRGRDQGRALRGPARRPSRQARPRRRGAASRLRRARLRRDRRPAAAPDAPSAGSTPRPVHGRRGLADPAAVTPRAVLLLGLPAQQLHQAAPTAPWSGGGIGCHTMVLLMDERRSATSPA